MGELPRRSYSLTDCHRLRNLAQCWQTLKIEQPDLRIRDAATHLEVGEADLVACTMFTDETTLLRPDCAALFEAFQRLGTVMASTRNEWAVIEKTGEFDHVDIGEHMGVVLNHHIDLRVFTAHCKHVFAVVNTTHPSGPLRSIQMFDAAGDSMHKVYVRPDGDVEAWRALVDEFRATGVETLAFDPRTRNDVPVPADFDADAFHRDWLAMTDTHEFFGMLRSHGLSRIDAFRNAPADHAVEVPPTVLKTVLERARDRELPIMVFVGSRGCIEIHTGPVQRVVETDDWLNVLDDGFNLHVRHAGLHSAWIVRKPTEDGIVTSVELFDPNDQLVLMMFGERKPGNPELPGWRSLVAELEASPSDL